MQVLSTREHVKSYEGIGTERGVQVAINSLKG